MIIMLIEAILEMEHNAQNALKSIQRDRDKLPARIDAEVNHIRQDVFREMEEAIREIEEKSQAFTSDRIAAIQKESANRLIATQNDYDENSKRLRAKLLNTNPSLKPV